MAVAFVLSGGASLGAAQVGMLRAMSEGGIRPDLVFGTSVGAINGGWVASDDGDHYAELAKVWLGLSRETVFPTRPILGLLGFLGRRPNLVPSSGVRQLLERHLTFDRLEDAPSSATSPSSICGWHRRCVRYRSRRPTSAGPRN